MTNSNLARIASHVVDQGLRERSRQRAFSNAATAPKTEAEDSTEPKPDAKTDEAGSNAAARQKLPLNVTVRYPGFTANGATEQKQPTADLLPLRLEVVDASTEESDSPWRFRFRFRSRKPVPKPNLYIVPREKIEQPSAAFTVAQIVRPAPASRRRRWLWLTGIAAIATGGAPFAFGMLDPLGISRQFDTLETTMQAIELRDPNGQSFGAVAHTNVPVTKLKDGTKKPMATLVSDKIPLVFTRVIEALEGESGILGISPLHYAASLACYPFEMLGVAELAELRLKKGKCAGGSTPMMQVARTMRNNRSRTPARKLEELADAIVLAFKFRDGSPARDRFIADHLHFGQAAGQPLYGIRAASLATFGLEPSALEEYQHAFLAALPKAPLALHCDRVQPEGVFSRQKARASYGLIKSMKGSPRLDSQLNKLAAMQPIPPLGQRTSFGLEESSAAGRCLAAAHPLSKAEVLDSSARLAAIAELKSYHAVGHHPNVVELGVSVTDQRAFKDRVGQQLAASRGSGQWLVNPASNDAVVLAFTTDANGLITNLHQSSSQGQLGIRRIMGSISKVPSMALLAEAGIGPNDSLCDRASRGRQNAGGGRGKARCTDSGAMIPVPEVYGRSLNLPIYEGLRPLDATKVAAKAEVAGFYIPSGTDPADALAFGTAEISPRHAAAMMGGIAKGVAGHSARFSTPHIVKRYRYKGRWYDAVSDQRDYSSWFGSPERREAIAAMAKSPLVFRDSGALGTLVGTTASIAWRSGEVGKSGTYADEGMTKGKYAAGGHANGSWFVMVVPARGNLGDGKIGITPLSKLARESSFRR